MISEETRMEVGSLETSVNGAFTPRRIKKKSTLAKLKDKKLRETGSIGSPSKQNSIEIDSDPLVEGGRGHRQNFSSIGSDGVTASPEQSNSTKKPHPKPRNKISPGKASSKLSGLYNRQDSHNDENTHADKELNLNHSSNSLSDGTTIQRFRDMKMSGDGNDSAEHSTGPFVPKPPTTPRTTPRTPRGFNSKGEKRNREPTHSGDEVEQKREKTQNSTSSSSQASNVKSKTPNNSSDGAKDTHENSTERPTTSDTKKFAGQRKSHKLLKRRTSRDAHVNGSAKDCAEGSSVSHGKPPISGNSHAHHGAITNNNRIPDTGSLDIGVVYDHSTSGLSVDELSQGHSSRDKSMRSRHKGSSGHRRTSSRESASVDRNIGENGKSSNKGSSHKASEIIDPLRSESSSKLPDKPVYIPPRSAQATTPPSNHSHLQPLNSPKSAPPPMSEEFSSHALRTAYKIDSNVHTGSRPPPGTERSDSGPSSGDRLSQKSFNSGSVLPVITTQEARSRSLTEGSIGDVSTSLLGPDELDRYFPERKINVLVGTWNVNELKDFKTSLDDFILPEKCDYVQDIYAIGTQENAMSKKEWEIKIQETLGPSHVLYHSVSLGSLHLAVFIRRDLIWFCSSPEEDAVSLRAVVVGKTKGAIGICFFLFGTSYLFINCHLSSDRSNDNTQKKSRLSEYYRIIQEMKFPKSTEGIASSKKSADITSVFDCVFWFGDLNFRIERKRHAVEGKVHQIISEEIPNFETLLGGDQLRKYMDEGKIFTGFQEGRINFHPTFKFDVNKDTYDSSSKNRVPSYTDRVMFRCKKKNDVTCLHYDAVMGIKLSDHRPVYGQYSTGIRPGKDSTVYCVGHFDRAVYMEANKRRAARHPSSKRVSSVCSIQ